jgi:NADH:ubiquinone oxidoreductase subunit E
MNAPESIGHTVPAVVQAALAEHAGRPGALLPILHAVQHALGHVPAEALPTIAAALNLSRAEVHGVVSYYHHFRRVPAGQCVVQVCRAESCQSRGSDALWAHACQSLGCSDEVPTSADGRYTVEPVYCLGLCAQSPAVMVGDRVHARVSPARFDTLIAKEAS